MRDDHTPPGGANEEEALRDLLRGAVEGVQPSAGALERLRYAVPARRAARRRRAFVGAAAATLLAGTAIPAVLHLAGGEGPATAHPAMAGRGAHSGAKPGAVGSDPHGHGSGAHPRSTHAFGGAQAVGGVTGEPDAAGGSPVGGLTAGPSGTGPSGGPAGPGGSGVGSGPMPPVAAPGVPGCGADQLGVVGSARPKETDGRVYGSFRVTNVSAHGCAVTGADTVTAASTDGGAAGSGAAVPVVGHTAGDPASGLLPDPSAQTPVLVLPPNAAYEIRFAWVPSGESCAATKPDTGGKPPQTEPAGTSGDAQNGAAATEPQTGTPPATAGVAVSHTPQAGAATTRTTIPEACGGTVYRTGAIPVAE